MKTALLYDSTDAESARLVSLLSASLSGPETRFEPVDTAAETLKPCTGCFGCWVKTPGFCIHTADGGSGFLRTIFDADHLVILSRITWGTYSTSIKGYCDRMLPLLHPYFRKLNGEMHHKLRYGKLPRILAVGFGALTEAEEETFKNYTESHRNNTGEVDTNGTFVCNAANGTEACTEWLLKETAK